MEYKRKNNFLTADLCPDGCPGKAGTLWTTAGELTAGVDHGEHGLQHLGREVKPLPACRRSETEAGDADTPAPWLPLHSLLAGLSKVIWQSPGSAWADNGAFVPPGTARVAATADSGLFPSHRHCGSPVTHRWGDPARGGG